MQRSAYEVEAALIGTDAIPPLKESLADLQQLRLHVVGVLVDDRIVAFVGYKRAWRTVDINRLVVLSTHFRRGYARRLLEYLHEAEPGAKFKVSTASANQPAIELYLALGYRPSREIEKDGVRITRFKRPRSRRK